MKDGFIKVAAATPKIKVADPVYNTDEIIKIIKETSKNEASVLVFSELTISGYTCGDLFLQQPLLTECKNQLLRVVEATKDEDMLTIIKKYLKDKYNKPGNVYLGLVHRLDRNVGGVMVFAKTSKAASRLSEQVRNKQVKKNYIAVVKGKIEQSKGEMKDYLKKDEKNNKSFVSNENTKNAKLAELEYENLKYDEKTNMSLVKINLKTGRHHQIRVQFSSRGHSLCGDTKYGTRSRSKQLALWSYKLSFCHPVTKEKLQFKYLPNANGVWNILKDIHI